MKNNVDKRIIKTKNSLKNALLSLLIEMPLSKISITKLCKEANIDRNTFYCHYSIPEDVLKEILKEHEQIILNIIESTEPEYNYEDMLFLVCSYLYENKNLSILIVKNMLETPYLLDITNKSNENVNRILRENNIDMNQKEIFMINRYATGGTHLLIQDWCLNGMKESPREFANKLNEYNSFFLNHYFVNN